MDEGLHLLRTSCRVNVIKSCAKVSEMCDLWKKLDCVQEELRMCLEEDVLCREIRNQLQERWAYLRKSGADEERKRSVYEESVRIMCRWHACKKDKARLRREVLELTSKIKVKKS